MEFFGLVFIVSTTLILFLKKEIDRSYENGQEENIDDQLTLSVISKLLVKIIQLRPVQKLLFVLFTCKVRIFDYVNMSFNLRINCIHSKFKIAFATHTIRSLKLIEVGVAKEKLGLLHAQFQFVQLLTPILIGKCINLNRPLEYFYKIYPIRLENSNTNFNIFLAHLLNNYHFSFTECYLL
jgi:PAT family acetyl-CoA transporter-like MFS transporter 1